MPINTITPIMPLGAGFRYSSYGPPYNPGPEYWLSVGQRMAAIFEGSEPQAIWIVGVMNGPKHTVLTFPCETDDLFITCGYVDMNEQALSLFDLNGVSVWLQVEPANADVNELLNIMLKQYSHHPSVIGAGIDGEWLENATDPEGRAVTDEEASQWVNTVHSYNPSYMLFLKHYRQDRMPSKIRDGIFFVDDSQQFESLDQMAVEFAEWGKTFSPSPVGFQFGYPADRKWWGNFTDPADEIGKRLLKDIPNTKGLFWVDFTVLDVFPPK